MSEKSDFAVDLFYGGMSCAQAVLTAFCADYDLEPDLPLRLGCGLSCGCRIGELCGAASGAVLVLGLKYGPRDSSDPLAKQACYQYTREFMHRFRALNGDVTCRGLLGYDLTDAAGPAAGPPLATARGLCPEFVRSAVELLEEMGC